MAALQEGTAKTMVFSHPNHELAVFGFLQRHRPSAIFLTDGGGEHRVAQTRRGLDSLGLLGRAFFLDYPERSFYAALLDRDVPFFREVAARTRSAFRELAPVEVLCDAVEYYNPVHDMAVPIVAAALADAPETAVFEVPLIHQKRADRETYAVQRFPLSRPGPRLGLALSAEEARAKAGARDGTYSILREQMGDVLGALPPSHLASEEFAPARVAPPQPPGPDQVLRYEWRATLLKQRREIDRMITFREHYEPVASALMTGAR